MASYYIDTSATFNGDGATSTPINGNLATIRLRYYGEAVA